MNVYEISFLEPLLLSPKFRNVIHSENFRGSPLGAPWKRIELLPDQLRTQSPDFYSFPRAFVCSHRVRLTVGALEDEGEFFPVRIKGNTGKYYLYNVTHCPSVLDPKLTLWTESGLAGVRRIKTPFFHVDRFGEDCVFKIPEDNGTRIYCLERDGSEEELKAAVRAHSFTGIKFKLVWTQVDSC